MNLKDRHLSQNMQGADVALLQSELAQLGYSIPTTETGHPPTFGPGTLQAVQNFQRKRGLPPAGVHLGVVDPVTARAINAAVDAIVPARFVVTGQVRHQDGTPLGGLSVRAFDKDLRNTEPLGEATTDATPSNAGRYQMAFTSEKFRLRERRTADVFVRVFSPEGVQLAESPVRFNAPATVTLDIVLAPLPVVTLSEYEQLVADLTPLLDGITFAQLTADDVSFLAQETSQPPARIQML
jgi:peptidoglycan hydrolase-like protein with peptidoglycan-binding domain